MKVLISGATGLIGTSLVKALQQSGHNAIVLSRSSERARHLTSEVYQWQPQTELVAANALQDVDAVVHLVGEHIAARRWNEGHKREIRDSRILSTRNLVSSFEAASIKPHIFVCASAIGFYGNRGDEILDESSAQGNTFLSEICAEWEAEADRATTLGIRTVNLRIGVVLSAKGGALEQMLTPFRYGVAGRLGSG
ncbi:MAG TPA: NAD-dependent epimerase/dehydratase family protein, partial [Blastocatellia bacterium]|nr:NAD-dependent epimerase/dehydratase family protein [Blastocatellia bacterium]